MTAPSSLPAVASLAVRLEPDAMSLPSTVDALRRRLGATG